MTSTTARPVRADWSRVTLAEYAALDLLRRTDLPALLDAHWDDTHKHNPFRGESPNRLTPDGVAWLAACAATVTGSTDETEVIAAARDFVTSMGTLLTMTLHRSIRSHR